MSDSTTATTNGWPEVSQALAVTPPSGGEPASQEPRNDRPPRRPGHRLKATIAYHALRVPLISDARIRRRIRREFERGRENGFLPKQLALETVSHCNAACIMCPYPTMTRHKGTMSAEAHRQIVDSVAAWGAPITVISHAGLGEPLVDKRLHEKVAYERKVFPDAEVAVFTNASLLTEKRARELHEAGVGRISVSLNGFRKETYEAVMKLDYEPTQENLHTFLRIREEEGWPITTHVSLIPTELHSEEEIAEFRAYWTPRVDQVIVPPPITWGGFFPASGHATQWSCRYIWEVLQVDWDGTVKMCCEDYDTQYPLGKLTEQSPNDIFNGPVLRGQRERQVKGDFSIPHLCQNCVESHGVARDFWNGAVLAVAPPHTRGSADMKVIATGNLGATAAKR